MSRDENIAASTKLGLSICSQMCDHVRPTSLKWRARVQRNSITGNYNAGDHSLDHRLKSIAALRDCPASCHGDVPDEVRGRRIVAQFDGHRSAFKASPSPEVNLADPRSCCRRRLRRKLKRNVTFSDSSVLSLK